MDVRIVGGTIVWKLLCAIIASSIASNRGRSSGGWFFGGFFLGVIGIIIVAVLPNLNLLDSDQKKIKGDQRRMREQLRQEKMKTDALRRESLARLDEHDRALGMDTRAMGAPMEPVPHLGESGFEASDTTSDVVESKPGPESKKESSGLFWHYEIDGETFGPVKQSELIALLKKGKVRGSNLVWTESLPQWIRADEVSQVKPNFTV